MARRRRRKTDSQAVGWLIIAGLVVALIALAVEYWYVTLPILAAIGGGFFWRRERRKSQARRFEREWEEAWEANLREWRELTFEAGPYSVFISGFVAPADESLVWELLCNVPGLRDQPDGEVDELVERVSHIAPQVIAEGIAQHNAVHLKEALERRGAKVKIKETVRPRSGFDGRREPIPASVRRDVWNRDSGRCVDCGSRERLEYDHIIAVVNGGSNTARNLELRCETCNRRKGAHV